MFLTGLCCRCAHWC